MSSPVASPCTVVLNQQREQTTQHHHEQCDQAKPVACKAVSRNCTVIENGQVVVRPIAAQPPQQPADLAPEA